VADALVAAGVGQPLLSVDWKGKSEPAVQTGDGVKEPLNRRATVDVKF
jgi:outer membrane protein OmpA-like peptidoglycan-associated protein